MTSRPDKPREDAAVPGVSVIIVSYNTKDLTRACIESVLEKTGGVDLDIRVVDNGSTDGSPEMLARDFPEVKLIRSTTNLGFARANNLAIRESKADYVFCLNSDTILVNNAIGILCDFMEREENRDVACCGGGLYDQEMNPHTSYGNFPSLTEIAFQAFKLKGVFRAYYDRRLKSSVEYSGTEVRQVDYVVGADMFLRKSVLDKTGAFDEDFFLYFEDTELGFRLAKAGYRSVIVPDAKIIHLAGRSTTEVPKMESVRTREKSRFLFFRKCYGERSLLLAKILYVLHYGRRSLVKPDGKSREMAGIVWRA
jgi:GT2 family glycosyltransferase